MALRLEFDLAVNFEADDEAFAVGLAGLAVFSLLLPLPFAVDVDEDGSAVVDARLGGLKGKRRFFCAAWGSPAMTIARYARGGIG